MHCKRTKYQEHVFYTHSDNGSVAERNKSVGYLLTWRNLGVYENVLAITIAHGGTKVRDDHFNTDLHPPHRIRIEEFIIALQYCWLYTKCVNTIGNRYADVSHILKLHVSKGCKAFQITKIVLMNM